MQSVLADMAVSVSELKKNPSAMMERLDDLELAELVRSRSHETPVPVNLDDL